ISNKEDKMSEKARKEFLTMVEKYEALKKELKEMKPKMQELLEQIGEGEYFTGNNVVYKVIRPEGTFVSFDKISYVRTKKEDEKRGSLSMKEAKEAGFNI
ncbi:MAG: hypothetical protein D6707_06705, partial [Bacteroidetes bacterium]